MNLTPELLAELEKVKEDFKQSQNEAVDTFFVNFIRKIENQPVPPKQSPASTVDKYAQVLPGDLPVPEGSFPNYEPVIYQPDDMIHVEAKSQKPQQQQSANKRLLEDNMLNIKDESNSGESNDGDTGTVAKKQKMSKTIDSETVEEDSNNESHDNDSFYDPETEVTRDNDDNEEYSDYEEGVAADSAIGAAIPPGGRTKLPIQQTSFTMSFSEPPEVRPFTPKEGAMASADPSKFNKFTILTLTCPLEGCDMVIDNQGDMNKHTNAPHSVPQVCPVNGCHQPFYISKELSVHAELAHQRFTRWTCDYCERNFGSFSLLNTHKFLQHHQGTFCCTDSGCSYMGMTRFEMLRHFDANHSISNNLPLNATLSSSSTSRNPPRQQVSSGQPRFATLFTVCIVPDCGAIFSNKHLFYDHLEHQHGILQFRCLAHYCCASFNDRTDLDLHIQRCHRAVTLWGCPFDYCPEPPAGDCYTMHKHIYLCHHEGKFKCSNCHFTAHNRISILKHFELLHI